MKKYNYVYKIENLINGKQYIGDHSTNNLNDGYLGSGVYLKKSIKKYGKNNFKKEILEIFDTKEEAFNAQEKYIKEYNTLFPVGYNISSIGGYGISKSLLSEDTKEKIRITKIGENNPMYGKHISESHKKIISSIHTNKTISKETKEKMSKSAIGRPKSEDHANKCRIANLGKKQSEETREKRRKSMIGKNKNRKTEEHRDKISKAKKGIALSLEHRKKLSEAAKKSWSNKNNN